MFVIAFFAEKGLFALSAIGATFKTTDFVASNAVTKVDVDSVCLSASLTFIMLQRHFG